MKKDTMTTAEFILIREKLGMTQENFAKMLGYKNAMSVAMKEQETANITPRDIMLLKPHLYLLTVPANFIVENVTRIIEMADTCFTPELIAFLSVNPSITPFNDNRLTCEDLYDIPQLLYILADKKQTEITPPNKEVLQELRHINTILLSNDAAYLRIIHL